MDLNMPLDTFRLHWNMAWRDDDESMRHSKLAKPPPPSCRRCNRLARASFSGPAKLSTLFPGRPLCAHVEAHNLGGQGRPPKLRTGPAGRGRAGGLERGERFAGRCLSSLAGPAGLWLLDAPPGIWRPGTEGPWVCQRGARAYGRAWSGTTPTTRVVGRRGRGLFSGNNVGQSFSRDQPGAQGFSGFRVFRPAGYISSGRSPTR